MVRILREQWIGLACGLFLIVNAVLFAKEIPWLVLLPIAVLLVWAMLAAADRLLLFIVFATPLSVNMEKLELGGIGVSLPTEPLMVALTLLFLLKLGLEKNIIDRRVWRHPITVVLGLQLLWMAICIIPSSMPVVSTKYLAARLWFVCTMYFMCTRLFDQETNRHRFFWAYLSGLCLVISYTLIRHATFGFAHEPAHWVMEPFFKDHTSYGAIIAFFFPFAVTAVGMPTYTTGRKAFGFLLLTLLTLGMIFSYTRAAWVGVAGAFALFLVMRMRIPGWLVAAVVVVAGAFYFVNQEQITIALEHNRDESSDDLAEHVSSISNISSDASNLERINRWNCALRMFEEKPLMGWGPGPTCSNTPRSKPPRTAPSSAPTSVPMGMRTANSWVHWPSRAFSGCCSWWRWSPFRAGPLSERGCACPMGPTAVCSAPPSSAWSRTTSTAP